MVINLLVNDGLIDLLDAAASVREDRDRVSVEAVTLRRGLARRLAGEGFNVRDVAALLGLSIGRAQQLIGEGSPMPATATAHDGRPHRTGHRSSTHTDVQPARDKPVRPVRTVGSVRQHRSYQHEGFFYRSNEDFLAGTVPFLLEGVGLGQPVMVCVTPRRLEQLRGAVGPDAPRVYFVDVVELGANPARIIPAVRTFVQDLGGPGNPVRGVAEPVWPGRRTSEIAETQLHEALLNLSVEPDTPFWLRCLYDAQALPGPVIEEASRSHPSLREGEGYRGSTSYGGPITPRPSSALVCPSHRRRPR